MKKSITIENLKQITRLHFDLPDPGVYLLSGANGTGKSTLLTCLLRIGRPNAFQNAFLTSKLSKSLDVFNKAAIIYQVGNKSVRYRYSGDRWAPTPKKHSAMHKDFGYPEVIFAGANASRIEARPEDFTPRRLREAAQGIRDAAQRILDNSLFAKLKIVNTRRGRNAEAFVIPSAGASSTAYWSEKNFSLGELCVLKLLRQLEACPEGSLVLIDELELALHPVAQVKLFEHLEKLSRDKSLTVFFSTHSVTLIKTAQRQQLYFLERQQSGTNLIASCYPSYALGQIAATEESAPDAVIFVEDDVARDIVRALVSLLTQREFSDRTKPTILVTPIGPFNSVIAFLSRAKSLLQSTVKQFAILDADVQDETIPQLEKQKNFAELAKFKLHEKQIRFLPWTPEVGICNTLADDPAAHERGLQQYLSDNRIRLDAAMFSHFTSASGKQRRDEAKKAIRHLIQKISETTQKSLEISQAALSEYFVRTRLDSDEGARLKELIMPIIKVK